MINPITFVLFAVTTVSLGSLVVYALKMLAIQKPASPEEHTHHGIDFSDYATTTLEDLK